MRVFEEDVETDFDRGESRPIHSWELPEGYCRVLMHLSVRWLILMQPLFIQPNEYD